MGGNEWWAAICAGDTTQRPDDPMTLVRRRAPVAMAVRQRGRDVHPNGSVANIDNLARRSPDDASHTLAAGDVSGVLFGSKGDPALGQSVLQREHRV
jgi:hypothetical protein